MDLKTYLFLNDLTASDFADSIGVHRNLISAIQTGKRPVALKTAKKIEKKTKGQVTVAELPLTEKSREMLLKYFEES